MATAIKRCPLCPFPRCALTRPQGDDGEPKDGDDNIAALTGDKDQEYESRLADARNKCVPRPVVAVCLSVCMVSWVYGFVSARTAVHVPRLSSDPPSMSAVSCEFVCLTDLRARRFLLSQLSPEQQQRYEFFRRSGFQRSTIKKVMQNVANTPISQTMAIVMAGISKVYVGELVETGALLHHR